MSRKQASRLSYQAPRFHHAGAWLNGVLLCLVVAPALAQIQPLNKITHADQALIQVTETALTEPVTTESGTVLRVERLGELIRFTATDSRTVTHSQWYDVTRREPHVVFGTTDKRFHEVDNRVLVKLDNPERLSVIAEEVDAVRAKRYPGLGYSILWLRPGQNPISTVKQLQSDHRIKHAELQLKRPLMLPL